MYLYINSFILEKVISFSKKMFFLRKNTIFVKKQGTIL